MAIGTPTQRYTAAASQTGTKAFSPATTVAAGSVAILCHGTGNQDKEITGVTDSVGNTWHVDSTLDNPAATVGATICSCQVATQITSSDTITITYENAGGSWTITQLFEVTGLATSTVYDKSAGAGAATGTAASSGATATLTQADELVMAVVHVPAALGWTEGSGYTRVSSADNNSGGVEYKVVAATTAVTAAATIGSSGKWGVLVQTYKGQSAVPPSNSVAPVASGTARIGQTLSCTTGTWTGDATITYTYQWQRAGVNIGGATSSSYVLVTADGGQAIRCRVTGTNAAGNSTASSNTLTPGHRPDQPVPQRRRPHTGRRGR